MKKPFQRFCLGFRLNLYNNIILQLSGFSGFFDLVDFH